MHVFYTYTDDWLTQSLSDECLCVMRSLVDKSEFVAISLKDSILRISFRVDTCIKQTVFAPPVTKEMSLDELLCVMQSNPVNVSDSAMEFLIDADGCNDYELFNKTVDFLRSTMDKNNTAIVGIQSMVRWKQMRNACDRFSRLIGLGCSVSEPGEYSDGEYEMYLPDDFSGSITISDISLDLLKEILSVCSVFAIDCNIPDGVVNITFYNE